MADRPAGLVLAALAGYVCSTRCVSLPEAFVEFHVRSARPTDLDAAVRILMAHDAPSRPDGQRANTD